MRIIYVQVQCSSLFSVHFYSITISFVKKIFIVPHDKHSVMLARPHIEKTLSPAGDVAGMLRYCLATFVTEGCDAWFDAHQ